MPRRALGDLFQDMLTSSRAVAPRNFCRDLGIPVHDQQDSQEFWKLLLPALAIPELTDLYQGSFEDYIVALDGSGRERRREESFLDVSLDVSSGDLMRSFRHAFDTPELLSEREGNGWRPEKGAEKVDAHKGYLLRPQGMPSILQCHLKRFDFDWSTESMSKINDRFDFPLQLDLSSICQDVAFEEDKLLCQYELQGIIVHVGEYGAGHYYAYVRPDPSTNRWYRFNDDVVEDNISFKDVCADAYGGRSSIARSKPKPLKGFFAPIRRLLRFIRRLFASIFDNAGYGYGGPTSNAYVLQYVRKNDIPKLYMNDD